MSAAFGLAALNALATAQQAQFMTNRSSLLTGVGAQVDPRILAMQHNSPAGLIPVWNELTLQVKAQAYSNGFLIAGACTLIGAVLALFLRKQTQPAHAEPIIIEM